MVLGYYNFRFNHLNSFKLIFYQLLTPLKKESRDAKGAATKIKFNGCFKRDTRKYFVNLYNQPVINTAILFKAS